MKQEEIKRIEYLLERFFDGSTSNDEEQELYALFARKDLPAHLEDYRPVIGYLETGIVRELGVEEEVVPLPPRKVSLWRRWIWTGVAVAASLLCLLVWNRSRNVPEEEFNPYAGSYIIRNGVKTELPESIARELDEMIRQAEKNSYEKERMAFRSLEKHRKQMDAIETNLKRAKAMEEKWDRIEKESDMNQ